jgi:methylenetetrahydrofolate reductase (NADPH)
MKDHIDRHVYHVEILPPKQDSEKLDADLEAFAAKYQRVLDSGYCACITDNAMGKASFQATELISELGLEVRPEQLLVHLNTFHAKDVLDEILDLCYQKGVRYLLAVTGDGSERLTKLHPADVGFPELQSVTSVELLRYIHRRHPGRFVTGVAFNPYEPEEHEFAKLGRKIEAGATFVITQPVLERHAVVDKLLATCALPVVLEAWMSRKLHLLSECVGYPIPEDAPYDPMACLAALHSNYPQCGMYLALLGFKTQYDQLATTWPARA